MSTRWFQISGRPGVSIYGSQVYWKPPLGKLEPPSNDYLPSETWVTIDISPKISILDFNPRKKCLTADMDSRATHGRLFKASWTLNGHLLTCAVTSSVPFVMYKVRQADFIVPMAHEGSYLVDSALSGTRRILRVQSFLPPFEPCDG